MTGQVILQENICLGDLEVYASKIPRYNSKKYFGVCGVKVPDSEYKSTSSCEHGNAIYHRKKDRRFKR
jgi:hypothetical protein